MRRGCIAVGKVECDGCHRPLKYGERYLVIDEEGQEKHRFCLDCCLSRGYVSSGSEDGKDVVTFLGLE